MAKSPPAKPRSISCKTDVVADGLRSRPLVSADPTVPQLFDAPLPGWIAPCLPTLVPKPPAGEEWVHEIKWDGYRVSAYVEPGAVTIRTRNGYDWTARFPTIAAALGKLKVRSLVIDGEASVLDEKGRSSFAELQADLATGGAQRAVLYAFDLLFLDGEDWRQRPLDERRGALAGLIKKKPPLLLSQEYAGTGVDFFKVACEHELEGIVSKRLDKPYRSGRSKDWLKTKCVQSGEFVVIGYQPSSGAVRAPLANIKVARWEEGALRYAGAVGTGFSERVARMLRDRLDGLRTPRCAIPRLKVGGAVWTKPDLIVEIDYRGLTADGELRHASFRGIAE
ncbi:DNA polymerase LigD, ligase domain protein [Methylocella silvestris BL2]|uniref:DNA ligase (ATP) n=1 Tax=Methylocella silvestris (strain DSM 15510 / CIP 108128 / LMG 27833 / NCIMB 13906 / BL2) TaxID=395965 RepID=B8EKY4_METSB|nr:non-homologous end-joining DNA ligase [Methylocella silvestris]ACK52012.1 DNA polymerase LigD, ligase domain protein [Methylocella silvestris BL2]